MFRVLLEILLTDDFSDLIYPLRIFVFFMSLYVFNAFYGWVLEELILDLISAPDKLFYSILLGYTFNNVY